MANPGAIQTYLGGLDSTIRKVLINVFDYVLPNLRWGRAVHQSRAENLQAYFLEGTTHSVANTEFSIAHGLASAPYLLIPVLPLDAEGAKLVPLEVSRAADASRVYLKSSETDAPIVILVEG
jgi:hypothetical protein